MVPFMECQGLLRYRWEMEMKEWKKKLYDWKYICGYFFQKLNPNRADLTIHHLRTGYRTLLLHIAICAIEQAIRRLQASIGRSHWIAQWLRDSTNKGVRGRFWKCCLECDETCFPIRVHLWFFFPIFLVPDEGNWSRDSLLQTAWRPKGMSAAVGP